MKKVSALLLSAASAAVLCSAGTVSYTLGDTDENGITDGRDASLILTEYARTSVGKSGTFTDIQNKAADVDENNIIDGRDASWILSYYAYISANGGEMDLRRFVKGEEKDISVKYDNSLENITKSVEAFEYYADRMNSEILQGASILVNDCNDSEYWMYGDKEAKVALLLMNDTQMYEKGVLYDIFKDYSDDDIKNGVLYLYRLAIIEEHTKTKIDFNDYTLNKEVGDYMNNLKNAAKIARETGNCGELNLFFGDENNDYLQKNIAAVMLTISYGSSIKDNEYYGTCNSISAYRLDDYEKYSSEIVKKLINQSTGG